MPTLRNYTKFIFITLAHQTPFLIAIAYQFTYLNLQKNKPMKTISIFKTTHRARPHIALRFDYDQETIKLLKAAPGLWWNPKRKCWLGKAPHWSLPRLKMRFYEAIEFVDMGEEQESITKPVKKRFRQEGANEKLKYPEAINDLVEKLMLKRYSIYTIKSYKSHFTQFLSFYPRLRPEDITGEQIRGYIKKRVFEDRISESTQNQAINAIKFYYEQVLGRERMTVYLDRPKKTFSAA